MTTKTTTKTESSEQVTTETLPDGDEMGNDILMGIGKSETARVKRSGKAVRDSDGQVRVSFEPSAWTIAGRVD